MEKQFFPLSVVTKRISVLLQPAISKQFWVRAEIASGRERAGAFYCDLVETDPAGKIIAKISCNIWKQEMIRIKELFKTRNMDLVLNDGAVVGFLCMLQYTPQYGISLKVIDADPSFALGEMEVKKREIIERLQKEGLFETNKKCFVPMLPLKLGLITSNGSAAYNDFIQTLKAAGFGFKVYLADAMMQGDQTEKAVLRSLDKLCQLNVELILITRGGGSKTDLYFLDNEIIARKIACCGIPVWTGIGHEIDTSVLDYVSNKSFKTPTAAGEELVARFVQMRRQLDESANTLSSVWNYRLEIAQNYIDRATTGIRQGSRKLLDVTSSNLRERAQELRLRVKTRISVEQITNEGRRERLCSKPISFLSNCKERLAGKGQILESRVRGILSISNNDLSRMRQRFDRERFVRRLKSEQDRNSRACLLFKNRFIAVLEVKRTRKDNLEGRFRLEKVLRRIHTERKSLNEKSATIKASDPKGVLKRGFALVHRNDGKLIRSINDVIENEKIITQFADGLVVSEVTSKENSHE